MREAAERLRIVASLTRKWTRELDYRLIKELWAYTGNRIAVPGWVVPSVRSGAYDRHVGASPTSS
jgi:nuclear transport factor 2 (NTF2) superfamily protein